MPLLGRFGPAGKSDKNRSTVWDKNTTRSVAVAFAFLALGILISWQWQRTVGKLETDVITDRPQREAAYWSQIEFLNPDLDPALKDDAIEMGWRVCAKMSAGWSQEQTLAYISQEQSKWNTSEDKEARKKPMLTGQLVFWSSLQDAAGRTLCPEYQEKVNKSGQGVEKSGP